MIYCQIRDGVVVNRAPFDGEMPEGWAVEDDVWIANDVAQIGWAYQGGEFTAPPPPPLPAPTADDVIAERSRRLASGFNHDFGDARGVHHIGTNDADMKGWDEVSTFANALVALGNVSTLITAVTTTGPVQITGLEWQQILVAAAQFRQPIWAASFTLQAMTPIPADYASDVYWPAA